MATSSGGKNLAGRILAFWRDVEVFNIPTLPRIEAETRVLRGKPGAGELIAETRLLELGEALPWELSNPKRLTSGDGYTWCHRVYVGVLPAHEWVRRLERLIDEPPTDDLELERLTELGFLASFDVDADGIGVAAQYAPAAFAFALERLRRGLEPSALTSELRAAAARHRQRLAQIVSEQALGHRFSGVIDWQDIAEEARAAWAPIGAEPAPPELRVAVRSTREELDEENPEAKAPTMAKDFFDSFFSRDLEKLRDALSGSSQESAGAALRQYLGPPVDTRSRIDVLSDPGAFAARLGPEAITLGRWPASAGSSLALAQQVAVGEAMRCLRGDAGLVAINGPPGTGKTTLLRDIIADIIVERGRRIAALHDPWELFEPRTTVCGAGFNCLRADLLGPMGIVVASSNNAAVENISRELPLRAAIASAEHDHPCYLANVAENLLLRHGIDAEPWGLVAAPLGKAHNRRCLAAALQCDHKGSPTATSLSSHLDRFEKLVDEEAPRRNLTPSTIAAEPWRIQKVAFLDAVREVERILQCYRDYDQGSAKLTTALRQRTDVHQERERAQAALDALRRDIELELHQLESDRDAARAAWDAARPAARVAERKHEHACAERAEAQQLEPWWVRGLWAFGVMSERRRQWRTRLERALAQERHATEELATAQANNEQTRDAWQRAGSTLEMAQAKAAADIDGLRAQVDDCEHRLRDIDQHVTALRGQLDAIERPRSRRTSELRALQCIRDDLHLESAWVDPELEAARGQLFLAALRLHETTLLACSKRVRPNLNVAASLLRGSSPEPTAGDADRVWRFIFFCVPVVSTTLASFGAMFGALGREAIGWLLVDEAGQATPQSVVGALWRSSRVIAIGDPLQIEPVVTQPGAIIRALRRRHGVGDEWSPLTQSAQTLADRGMSVGAQLHKPRAVWTGLPLRAHRRCGSPMFETANAIAYDGQMVQAVKDRAPLRAGLGECVWYDVRGAKFDGHVVHEELDALDEVLRRMREGWPRLASGESARVFVISPFRTVAKAVTDRLLAHRRALDRTIGRGLIVSGTVHTFQGKEADVVILMLGSAPGNEGAGSRAWAAATPNLLNVAVTRAKSAIYVIGSRADWASCDGFDFLAGQLRPVPMRPTPAKPAGAVEQRGASQPEPTAKVRAD